MPRFNQRRRASFIAILLGVVFSVPFFVSSASAAPALVSAEATQLEWEATGPEGADVTLDGSASSDDITAFAWWLNCPATPCAEENRLTPDGLEYETAVVTLPIGSHVIYLWATDGADWAVAAPITVTVNEPAPVPPVANAGPDQVVAATSNDGAEVSLDGSASTGALEYEWALPGGATATGATPDPVLIPIGVHEITLTVFGEDEQESTDTVSITVNPVAVAGDDQTLDATSGDGANVTLDGTGSFGTAIVWSTPEDPDLATGANPDPVLLPIGVHEITVTATGPDSLSATDTVTVTVNPVADAGEDQTVTAGEGGTADVTLDGSGSIGDLGTLVWSTATDPDLAVGENPVVNLPVGVHEITLTITGPDELSATDTVTITVNEPPLVNPGATVLDWDATSATGALVTLDGSLSTDDALQFAWWEDCPVSGCPDGTRLTPDSLESEVADVELAIGVHEIYLWAELPEVGWTVADPITVTVNPVAVAGPDQVVQSTNGTDAEVTLDGTESLGDLTTLAWSTATDPDLATGENPVVTLPVGVHEITLTITGPDEVSDTDTVTIAVEWPGDPTATVDPERGTVNTTVAYAISGFPPETEVQIDWIRTSGSVINMGTVTTDFIGSAEGELIVPATPGGINQIRFTAGDVTAIADYEVAPRIKVIPGTVQQGQVAEVSLRGFGRQESVLIRWLVDGTWVPLDTVTTSNTGSANVDVTVPINADIGQNSVRGDGAAFAAQTNAVEVTAAPGPPAVTVTPTRGTVNTTVDYTIANFPANATVEITWRRTSGSLIEIGTVDTDETGGAAGDFAVPATPGGANQVIRFTSGAVTATALYEVAPRIKVLDEGAPGDQVEVSLRGFGKQEEVLIRWRVDGVWVEVGTVTASNTGSANLQVTIPEDAAAGNNSVRGDGPTFAAQTNVAVVTE